MKSLSYEQTVVATHLEAFARIAWLADGGRVEKAAGKRRWKAIK
jgi:hypothetical protein